MELLFYRLSRSPLEAALPALLDKARARELRAIVRVGADARVRSLSDAIWRWRDDAFLAHGAPGEPSPERQPIYLTSGLETPNRPDVAFYVDRAEPDPEALGADPAGLSRACLLFAEQDAEALAAARSLWTRTVAAALPAAFWAEEPGRGWTKKAEVPQD